MPEHSDADPDAVARDDAIVEQLRAGGAPDGYAEAYLADLRDRVDTPVAGSALAAVDGAAGFDDPARNPIAFLPVDDDPAGVTYSRFVGSDGSPDALFETGAHVRAHLSMIATRDDNADTRAEDVQLTYRPQDGGTLIVGYLPDAAPTAPYLDAGYNPDTDHTGHTFERWVPDKSDEVDR